jgi:hypothetical protein
MYDFTDKTPEKSGTPINRKSLMAVQGFIGSRIQFYEDRVIETFDNGNILTTIFNEDGSISEVFQGEKTITKDIIFRDDGSIREVVL